MPRLEADLTVDAAGCVTIPSELLADAGLRPGDALSLSAQNLEGREVFVMKRAASEVVDADKPEDDHPLAKFDGIAPGRFADRAAVDAFVREGRDFEHPFLKYFGVGKGIFGSEEAIDAWIREGRQACEPKQR